MIAHKTRAKKQKTRKVEARKAPPKRTKRTRTVAEARGLAHQDDAISSKPSEPHAREGSAITNITDQQFGFWSAMMRMSPLPFVLQQQATVAKLIMSFMLPGNFRRTPD